MGEGIKREEMRGVSGPSGEPPWTGLGSASVFHHRTTEDPVDPVGSGYSFPLPRAASQES